jgi:N-dimethylarginine dimethylaminohydrolase
VQENIINTLRTIIIRHVQRKERGIVKRLLIILTAAALAIIICAGTSSAYGATQNKIGVDYEYGVLREVVVGVPFMIYPDLRTSKWAQEALKILPESEVKKSMWMSGKDSITVGQFQEMEKENKELIAILENHGVKVWRPDILTRGRVVENFGEEYVHLAGVSQQYTRDPVIVIGNNVIENTMGSLYRRSDILGLVRLLRDRLMGSNARWVAMPAIDYSLMINGDQFDKTGFPVLEGGDVIVLGKKIFVGTSKNRTTGSSELGYLWLKGYLEPQGYDVERVRLPEDVLHLDVALSVPRPGVIIVCPEVFIDGIPSYFKGWKRIEVSREETRYLATNGLPIDKEHYIMGYNEHFDGKCVRKALEECGIKVYPVSFAGHTQLGGSIRCSTLPFVRKLDEGKN